MKVWFLIENQRTKSQSVFFWGNTPRHLDYDYFKQNSRRNGNRIVAIYKQGMPVKDPWKTKRKSRDELGQKKTKKSNQQEDSKQG